MMAINARMLLGGSSITVLTLGLTTLAPMAALAHPLKAAAAVPAATVPVAEPAAVQAVATESADGETSDIVVTGFRASLENALDKKRRSNQIIDAITAEDIADFPDANLAESIQRLPGVSIDRDNGEGRTITVRGLGGDFQQTRLNGADAQSAAGGNNSDSGANRSRGFDFNTFASELFGGVTITKTTSAANDEGSLGAIIDLTTGRPLSFKTNRLSFGGEAEYRENGETFNPRLTALVSHHFADNFAVMGTVAYQKQEQQIDAYRRNIGQFDYTYRNSQHNGKTPNVFGFAQPSTAGTGVTYGSDPAAYALVTPTTLIPALPSIGRQELSYERLGATATAQWRPTSRTEIIADFVYSRYTQDSVNTGITTIGLNRNGTNARVQQNTLRAVNTANGLADRVALYPTCTQSTIIDCGQAMNGTNLVAGMRNSYNPNNLNPFDYYNSVGSPGYIANTNQIAYYNELIGRPSTIIRAAHVNGAGEADYLVLDDVDWRSFADAQYGKTNFIQGTLNFTQELSDSFRADGTIGYSRSEFSSIGLLAEFNAIDRDNYTFDERGDGKMPIFSPGFDVANPANWSLVKGLSTIRYFTNIVTNEFRVGRLNFALDMVPDKLTMRFGGTYKQFDFGSDQGRRNQSIEAINPTLAEARLGITDLGQTVGFGQGLNVPAGTPTSYYAPDLDKFRQQFGIDCNCINKWGDFRAVVDGRQRNAVTERDLSGFFQIDYKFELFGRPLRGDAGLRIARTRVAGNGSVGGADGVLGLPVTAHNEYFDWLPSANVNYEPFDGFLVRFAAADVIARPQLSNLTPGTTAFASGLATTGAAPTVTIGNPYLKPFRATNFDLSFEKYFGKGGLVSVTLFSKDIASFPQQIAGEAPLSSVFEPALYDQVVASMTSPTLQAYTLAGGTWAIRQFRDAPGGVIKGIEVNAQTDFFFLPAPFDDFGITANYTHISSKLSYLTGTALSTLQTGSTPTASNTYAEGPFLNTSPDAFNATLYYENKLWSARVSGSYRKRYVNRFPLASGTCSVGTTTSAGGPCNSPVFADFGYNENTLNVDFAFAWNITKFAKLTLEGRNLTNDPQYRTMYAAEPVSQTYASTGRIFTAGARLSF
ncbi:MAG: TonB-dependent receptor [Sphingomonas bacterium]|uniref:TonB-dependent receptor n=1 Tax=Sphingomonas bacterium TaxID=1895847 RepID=UPI002631F552|nr:TonB-dependent receptor [Sphingomonas bacterium]MDB5705089.1 TonB-dependent receptor [Sphingomonas bacterium]